jgi:hypothetical protein
VDHKKQNSFGLFTRLASVAGEWHLTKVIIEEFATLHQVRIVWDMVSPPPSQVSVSLAPPAPRPPSPTTTTKCLSWYLN